MRMHHLIWKAQTQFNLTCQLTLHLFIPNDCRACKFCYYLEVFRATFDSYVNLLNDKPMYREVVA